MVRTMTPVTNPALIAQLEGGGNTGLKPVTEPALISQLEGGAQPQTNPSLLPRIGADALAGAAQFGNNLINAPHNIANAISPSLGAKVPSYLPNYNYSQALGVDAPNIGDKLLQGAVQFAPYMALPGGAIAQGAAFGATQSQNPIAGTLTGGALGAVGEFAPALIKGAGSTIKKATDAVQPQKQAEQILQTLGDGRTLEGNAQSLAQDIQSAYQQQVKNGQAKYAAIFNNYGNNPIYNRLAPIFGNTQKGVYENIANEARQNYGGDLKDLHDEFISNPTLNNAHQLQSQLGAEIGSLSYQNAKGMLDAQGKNQLQALRGSRSAILSDINNYLGNQGLDAVSAYRSATNNWQQNVTPYLADSNLAQIAKGEITNPTYSQINSIFKNPEPEINKVVGDIGAPASNKILFNKIGKTQANLTPEKLTNAFNQLDNDGLSSYVSPTVAQQFDQLVNKTNARNAARTAGGALVGAHFGGPLGAAAGAVATPVLSSLVSRGARYLPSLRMQLLGNIAPGASLAYRPLAGAITADTINSTGGR